MVIISNKTIELPISKEQYLESIPRFINQYGRLPLMQEDDIEVEIDEEIKVYRSLRYVKEYFGNNSKFIEELFELGLLSFKIISDKINIEENRVEELVSGEADKVDKHERRMIELFFNKDYYSDLGKYNASLCNICTKKRSCGQGYWVDVIGCSLYKKSKAKKK